MRGEGGPSLFMILCVSISAPEAVADFHDDVVSDGLHLIAASRGLVQFSKCFWLMEGSEGNDMRFDSLGCSQPEPGASKKYKVLKLKRKCCELLSER